MLAAKFSMVALMSAAMVYAGSTKNYHFQDVHTHAEDGIEVHFDFDTRAEGYLDQATVVDAIDFVCRKHSMEFMIGHKSELENEIQDKLNEKIVTYTSHVTRLSFQLTERGN